VEDPCYDKIRAVYRANGVTCEPLRMGKDGILSAQLSESRANVLHVTPFHSYPSGITADASKRREYLAFAKERDAIVIEDDFDSELTVSRKQEDTLFSLCDEGRVIYLNTFTATLAPSMRIGYMVLSPVLMEAFLEKLGFYSCTVPVFEQYVLAELIDGGDFERHINRIRRRRRAASKG
jgi:GntR family transcriptional regulator/MocR family aminotransferase